MLEVPAELAAAGEAAEEVEVMRKLPFGIEPATDSLVVPEPMSGEGQIREQVVVHGEAGLTVESEVEADARADAEEVAEVAEEERPKAEPARRWRERRGDEEEAARHSVVEAEEMEAGPPHSAQQETTHVARSPSYSPVSRPATPVTERRAAATAAAAAQPVATALSLLRVGSGRAVDGVADGPHGRTPAADRRLVVMDDGAPLSVEEVLTTADTLAVIMGLLSLADLLVAAQVCKALKGWAWLAHALLPLKTKLPYLVDGGLPEGMLRNRWTCPSREGQLGATALGAAQTAVRVLRLNGRLLEPLAAYYRQEYDLTHHLDGPVCDAARRMFRNAPRPSSPTAYLLQLQQAASAWSNAWQTWGLDATLRRGLYSFFASRLWLLVRSRGAAAAFAEWLYADAGLWPGERWGGGVGGGGWGGRNRELEVRRRALYDRWKRLLNLLYGCAEDAPRSIRPYPPPPPTWPPA